MNQGLKRIIRTITTILVIVAMLFAFAISGIRLFGFDIYGVLSGSMEPTYPTGSLIYVREVDPQDLRINDVITYSMSGGAVVTHRIVEMVPNESNPNVYSYRTKGDANKDVDSGLVSSYNIIGKVMFHLPGMGYVAQYIQSPPGMYVAIGLSLAMIAFVFITDEMMKDEPDSKKKSGKKKSARKGARKKQAAGLAAVRDMIPGKKKSAAAARMQAKRQQMMTDEDEDEEYDEQPQRQQPRARQQQYGEQQQARYARPPQQYGEQQARYARPPQQYGEQQQARYARPPQQYGEQQARYARPQQQYGEQQHYARPQQSMPRITYEMLTPAQKDWYQEMLRRGYTHEQIMNHVQQQYAKQNGQRQ